MLLEDLQQRFLSSDVVTCNACISAISACETETWQRALGLLALLSTATAAAVTASLITYNATLSACKVLLGWVPALQLLALVLQSRTSPDLVTHNAAITACCTQWQWAFSIYHRLKLTCKMQSAQNALRPQMADMADIITYGAIITASAARWRSAVGWTEEMIIRHLQPDVVACNSSMSACEKTAQWQQSWCLLTTQSLRGPKWGWANWTGLLKYFSNLKSFSTPQSFVFILSSSSNIILNVMMFSEQAHHRLPHRLPG